MNTTDKRQKWLDTVDNLYSGRLSRKVFEVEVGACEVARDVEGLNVSENGGSLAQVLSPSHKGVATYVEYSVPGKVNDISLKRYREYKKRYDVMRQIS